MMLTVGEIVTLIFFYIATFPMGFILLNIFFHNILKLIPFVLILGLSLSFGLVLNVIFLSITAFFIISLESFLIITVLSWLGFLLFITKRPVNYGHFNLLSNLTSLIVLLISFFYVGYYLVNTPWHAADDARRYGFMTSLLRYNGKNTMTLFPYSDISTSMERGVSIIAANIAEIGGFQNGKAVMVAGSLAVILVPILLYAIMFSLTDKNFLSLIAALISYNVYNHPYGMSIWCRFFSGNYGNVYGLFFILIYIWSILNSSKDIDKQFTISLFLLMASYFVYMGYVLHMFIFTFSLIFVRIMQNRSLSMDDCKKITILFFPVIVVIMLLYWPNLFPKLINLFFWPILDRFSKNRLVEMPPSIENLDYALNLSYFSQNVESILLIPLMISAVIGLFQKDRLRNLFSYFYLFISTIVTFYALSGLTRALFLVPKRTALVANYLTYLMLLLLLHHYYNTFNLSKIEIKKFKTHIPMIRLHIPNRKALLNLCILFLSMLLCILSLVPHLTYSYPKNKSWYVHMSYFEPNFKAALWLNKHVTSSDLILNDMAFTGYMLLSMGVFNLTYADPISYIPSNRERAIDLWNVWIDPYDEVAIRNLLFRYNVTYILSDADWKIFALRISELEYVTKNGWMQKPYFPMEICRIFDTYPFLEIVFKQDLARVYKILPDKLQNYTVIDRAIVDDEQTNFLEFIELGGG